MSIGIGIGIELIIEKLFPGKDVFYVFNGFILYYFAVDFLMRMQLQELPTLSIAPYLHLKIPRNKIVRFLNVRSLFSAFNILPLFIFIPFCCTAITDIYGAFVALMYIIAIVSLCAFNNYTVMYIKRLTTLSVRAVIIVVMVIATLAALEYFKILSISALSNRVFGFLSSHPLTGFVFSIAAGIPLIVNSSYLRSNMYVEELGATEVKKNSTDYPFSGDLVPREF